MGNAEMHNPQNSVINTTPFRTVEFEMKFFYKIEEQFGLDNRWLCYEIS